MARLTTIVDSMSSARFSTYLAAMNRDREAALDLYLWNAKVGEAFHIPIQETEIALRNRGNQALVARFGPLWWREARFLALASRERVADLDVVRRRIANRKLSMVTDQIVAGLSLGFWTGMVQARYNPEIWSSQLRLAFPHLPATVNRESLARRAGRIAYFRNRIWHHEPIFKSDLSLDFAEVMGFLRWLCPSTHDWIRPHCRVPELLRQKPRPKPG